MTNDIVKEAIADAKQLREGAIANAQEMLKEKFMPRLEAMIEETLSEEDEMEFDETTDENYIHDGEDGTPATLAEEDCEDEDLEESFITEEELDALLASEEITEDEDEEGDLDLESLLRELDDCEEDEVEENVNYTRSSRRVPVAEDNDDLTESELNELLNELDLDEADKAEDDDAEALWDELEGLLGIDQDDEPVNADDLGDEKKEPPMESFRTRKSRVQERENRKLQKDLKEAYNVIKMMREKINEVNLMNSKLLYTNKIFNANQLSETQKMKVLETFDKAATLREVKLVYSTITGQLKEKQSSQKRVTESRFASDTILTEGRTTQQEEYLAPIKPQDRNTIDRFQSLAGLKDVYR